MPSRDGTAVSSGRQAEQQLAGWVAPYARFVADHMNLRDWKLVLELDAALRDSLATIAVAENRQLAFMRIGEDFFAADEEDQRHGIVHELVHLHLEPARRAVGCIEAAVTAPTWAVFQRNHDDQIEGAVDRLAASIAKGLPLPGDWRRGGKGRR